MPVTLLSAGDAEDEQDNILVLKGVQSLTQGGETARKQLYYNMVNAKIVLHEIGAMGWLIRACWDKD